MLLLSLDTSGREGSMALARALPDTLETLDLVSLAGGAFSARLIPELALLLERNTLQKGDLGGLVVISGPGSFTGLRVGLAAIKGLAEILQIPIAAVSMLEVVATRATSEGPVIAALDAGRREVYVGEYELARSEPKLVGESLVSREQFLALLDAHPGAELISPCPDLCQLASLHLHVRQIDWPDAGRVARTGFRKLRSGNTSSPETLEANYIRRPDAEISPSGSAS
jgi:tRNA threonylcarbamoyladenosine biosynthesis protein TsaB